ncbi:MULTISPECIES: hypothetical protein [Corynebacterium]|uniref:hypothetical protein n=1 Tax=Corynebacterium TaxID=1716 RepID=UPI00124D924D|nr:MULTISPECIES: hypothetical protein [Corynebacterium]
MKMPKRVSGVVAGITIGLFVGAPLAMAEDAASEPVVQPGTETSVAQPGTETEAPEAEADSDAVQPGTETEVPEPSAGNVEPVAQPGTETEAPEAEADSDAVQPGTETEVPEPSAENVEPVAQPGTETAAPAPSVENTELTEGVAPVAQETQPAVEPSAPVAPVTEVSEETVTDPEAPAVADEGDVAEIEVAAPAPAPVEAVEKPVGLTGKVSAAAAAGQGRAEVSVDPNWNVRKASAEVGDSSVVVDVPAESLHVRGKGFDVAVSGRDFEPVVQARAAFDSEVARITGHIAGMVPAEVRELNSVAAGVDQQVRSQAFDAAVAAAPGSGQADVAGVSVDASFDVDTASEGSQV